MIAGELVSAPRDDELVMCESCAVSRTITVRYRVVRVRDKPACCVGELRVAVFARCERGHAYPTIWNFDAYLPRRWAWVARALDWYYDRVTYWPIRHRHWRKTKGRDQ